MAIVSLIYSQSRLEEYNSGVIPERFQSKALCMIVDAPWFVPNTVMRTDLRTPTKNTF
jgi:hypothetical protein